MPVLLYRYKPQKAAEVQVPRVPWICSDPAPKALCPNTQTSINEQLPPMMSPLGTIFKMPGFSSLPAEQSSSCGPTHNVVTGWEARSSAGEGSSPTET